MIPYTHRIIGELFDIMKFVKNVDDLKNFTFDFFDSFLSSDLSEKMVNYFLLGAGNFDELVALTKEQPSSAGLSPKDTFEYGEVILQLRDYKDLLKKFVEYLLACDYYEQLSAFLNRIFLQQIGPVKYHSSRKDYTIRERYFDRFVEIINYCEIPKDLYSKFFLKIFNSDSNSYMFFYKEPLKEYLDIFLKNGNQDFVEKLVEEKAPQQQAPLSTKMESINNLRSLISDYVNGDLSSGSLIRGVMDQDKGQAIGIIETYLASDDDTVIHACELLMLLDDKHAREDLKAVFENTKSIKVKAFLEKNCGFASLSTFASKEQFLQYVDSNVEKIQDRLYGIRLTRYYKKYNLKSTGIDGKVLTFILDTFRSKDSDEFVSQFGEYFKFVDTYTMQCLCNIVFEVACERDRLLSSLWAIRFISCFGSSTLLEKVFENMKSWIVLADLRRPCEYFLDIMSQCARREVLDGIRMLLDLDLSPRQRKSLEQKLELFSESNKEDIEQVKDKMVYDLDFDSTGTRIIELNRRKVVAKINIDCTISLYNYDTMKPARINSRENYNWEDVHTYIKSCEKKIKEQKKRLYSAFLEFRNYDNESFKKCILDNNLLNFLSQHVFWGRYRNDNLVEVCIVREGRLSHLLGNMLMPDSEYTIAMLQPIDAVNIKDKIQGYIEPLFDQLDFPYFTKADINPNVNYVDKLSGTFCNAQLFITRLQKLKYKVADLDIQKTFGMLVKKNENLGLITTVEFDRVPLSGYDCPTTLSKIRFYELNKRNENIKASTFDKSTALMLTNINPHVLSNELALILNACRN